MKVYIDTNVYAYAAGAGEATPQQRRDSRQLLRLARRRRIAAVTSPVTAEEIEEAPDRKLRRRAQRWLVNSRTDILPAEWTISVEALAGVYRSRGAVPPAKVDDARHLAWAATCGAIVLASWNRKHLVRLKTRFLVGIIHSERRLAPIAIEFPTEVIREVESA